IEFALRLALAVHCEIQPISSWARKHYFYPDLPKGYQITQADQPYARGGYIEISGKRIPLQRIHIEEDAGKNVHLADGDVSLIDYNRAGAPLGEIVSLPELRSAAEAADHIPELRTIVRYLRASEGRVAGGALRCAARRSPRRPAVHGHR